MKTPTNDLRELEEKLSYIDKVVMDWYVARRQNEAIKQFCKDKYVFSDFECGEHGIVPPEPCCSECHQLDKNELIDEILGQLPKEADIGETGSYNHGYNQALSEVTALLNKMRGDSNG